MSQPRQLIQLHGKLDGMTSSMAQQAYLLSEIGLASRQHDPVIRLIMFAGALSKVLLVNVCLFWALT